MHYLVTLRDDRGESRKIKAIIESEESLSALTAHSHILEVHVGAVPATKIPEKIGFLEVSEEEAAEFISPVVETTDEVADGEQAEEVETKPKKK